MQAQKHPIFDWIYAYFIVVIAVALGIGILGSVACQINNPTIASTTTAAATSKTFKVLLFKQLPSFLV